MKYGYVTLLSSEDYLPGVIGLYRSLKDTGTKIPFECVCSKGLDKVVIGKLHKEGISTYQLEKSATEGLEIPNQAAYAHWKYTFDKLLLYGNMWGGQFDKIVFLDSDMLITANIDALFEYPNFTACRAGYFLNQDWTRLNSGLMVIEPNEETLKGLLAQIPITMRRYAADGKNVGDQDVFNDYVPDWPEREELHLPEGFNMFFKNLSLANAYGFSFDAKDVEKRISVVHFIGAVKPWHLKGIKRWLYPLKLLLKNRYGLGVFMKYMKYIKL